MATHASTFTWKIPWTEEPGRLQSVGSLRVGHDSVTSLSRTGEGNGNPLQCSCLENPRDRGAWWGAICGVAQSQTRVKRLSSSSSNLIDLFQLCCVCSCSEWGLFCSCGAWMSHCGGFSCCGAWALGCTGFSSCSMWAQ